MLIQSIYSLLENLSQPCKVLPHSGWLRTRVCERPLHCLPNQLPQAGAFRDGGLTASLHLLGSELLTQKRSCAERRGGGSVFHKSTAVVARALHVYSSFQATRAARCTARTFPAGRALLHHCPSRCPRRGGSTVAVHFRGCLCMV